MASLSEVLKALEPYLTSGAAVTTLVAALKVARQSKRWTDALDTVERIETLIEGDKKAHHDPKIRDGLLRRLENIEELAKKSELTSKLFKAFLRALGIPSDYEDDERLEEAVAKRLSPLVETMRSVLSPEDQDRLRRLDQERERREREREREREEREREREREERARMEEVGDTSYRYLSHDTDFVPRDSSTDARHSHSHDSRRKR